MKNCGNCKWASEDDRGIFKGRLEGMTIKCNRYPQHVYKFATSLCGEWKKE